MKKLDWRPAFLLVAALLLVACAGMTLVQTVDRGIKTVDALKATVPELVASGDLTEQDASKTLRALDEATERLVQARHFAVIADGENAEITYESGIAVLRALRDTVENERLKQDIGRAVAALTFASVVSGE